MKPLPNGSFRIYCLICVLFLACGVYGQGFGVERFTSKDGLLKTHIRKVQADREGYLWFATKYGLSRFNGHEFTNHTHDPRDSTSLGLKEVSDLFLDSNKNLWIAGDSLCHYDCCQHEFVRIPNPEEWHFNSIIGEDSRGFLWLASTKGFVRFDPSTSRLDAVHVAGFRHALGNSFAIGPGDRLWGGDSEGVHCFAITDSSRGLRQEAVWSKEQFTRGTTDFKALDFHWESREELWIATSFPPSKREVAMCIERVLELDAECVVGGGFGMNGSRIE